MLLGLLRGRMLLWWLIRIYSEFSFLFIILKVGLFVLSPICLFNPKKKWYWQRINFQSFSSFQFLSQGSLLRKQSLAVSVSHKLATKLSRMYTNHIQSERTKNMAVQQSNEKMVLISIPFSTHSFYCLLIFPFLSKCIHYPILRTDDSLKISVWPKFTCFFPILSLFPITFWGKKF